MKNLFNKYDDWQFTGDNNFHKIHTIHPYFAKYHPQLPRRIIEYFTKEGDVVLDPFCGCGTTLVESALAGRESIGVDANPIGCMISEVKTIFLKSSQKKIIEKFLSKIQSEILECYNGKNITYQIPDFHNKEYWFTKEAQMELDIIKGNIQKIKNLKIKKIAMLSFSRIILFASNQETESRYKRVLKNRSRFDVYNKFVDVFNKNIEFATDFTKEAKSTLVKIYNKDSRNLSFLKDKSVNLIVTSPPYLNSWDYGLYHRFRFFWTGFDVHDYEDKEIGKHLRTLEGRSKRDEIERYRVDMGLCLKEFARVIKKNGFCCIVNANSIVKKKFIDTNQILIKVAEEAGLKYMGTINRNILGPHYGMHASLNAKNIIAETNNFKEGGKTQKSEQILVFQK